MKNFIFIFIVISFSCTTYNKPEKRPKAIPEVNKFVLDFAKRNPNWSQNDILNTQTSKYFEKELIKFYKTSKSLDSLTLTLEKTGQLANKVYVAKFVNSDQSLTDNKNIYIEIVGLIDKKMVSELTTEKKYTIKGTFIRMVKDDVVYISPSPMNNISVEFNKHITTDSTYYLGMAFFVIDKITPYKRKSEYL
jgi:hypothetical protein